MVKRQSNWFVRIFAQSRSRAVDQHSRTNRTKRQINGEKSAWCTCLDREKLYSLHIVLPSCVCVVLCLCHFVVSPYQHDILTRVVRHYFAANIAIYACALFLFLQYFFFFLNFRLNYIIVVNRVYRLDDALTVIHHFGSTCFCSAPCLSSFLFLTFSRSLEEQKRNKQCTRLYFIFSFFYMTFLYYWLHWLEGCQMWVVWLLWCSLGVFV